MTIFVTTFDPDTLQVTGASADSGFRSLDEVVGLMGEPIRRGVRTVTYSGAFYSNYSVTGFGASAGVQNCDRT